MTIENNANHVGINTVTPYFTVPNADQFITFVLDVFDGTLLVKNRRDDGTIQHARIKIGDTIIMLNEETAHYPANSSQMHVYVSDIEDTFAKALKVGATEVMAPNLRPHGDRMAGVRDPFNNVWWIAAPA